MNEKIAQYLKALDGITYKEWKKLYYILNKSFEEEQGKLNNSIKLSLTDETVTLLLSE